MVWRARVLELASYGGVLWGSGNISVMLVGDILK